MSDQENIDIGRVVSLIMENPELIRQIQSLAKQENTSDESPVVLQEQNESVEPLPQTEPTSQTSSQPTYAEASYHRSNRAQLLGALKPYVSKERAKAIDSMISIADVLEMMKTR